MYLFVAASLHVNDFQIDHFVFFHFFSFLHTHSCSLFIPILIYVSFSEMTFIRFKCLIKLQIL